MQNPVSKHWSPGTIMSLNESPGSYIVFLQNDSKVYKGNMKFLDQET